MQNVDTNKPQMSAKGQKAKYYYHKQPDTK